jgi:hypothetical protein
MSTLADPEGRPTVRALLRAVPERLYPVGRLDFNTTGSCSCSPTTARSPTGCSTRRCASPASMSRRSAARPDERPSPACVAASAWRTARRHPPKYAPSGSSPPRAGSRSSSYEGRAPVVRRMCEAVGHPVEKLKRVRFGPLALGTLPPEPGAISRPVEVLAFGWRRAQPAGGAARRPKRGTGTPRARHCAREQGQRAGTPPRDAARGGPPRSRQHVRNRRRPHPGRAGHDAPAEHDPPDRSS